MQETDVRTGRVLLNIKGMRSVLGEDEIIEIAAAGTLSREPDRDVLRYADEHSGADGAETEIVVEDGMISMCRTGAESTEMFFKPNTPYSSFYSTPFGRLDVTVLPTMVKADMGEEAGRIELEYIMNIAGSQFVNKLLLSYKKDMAEEGRSAGKEKIDDNRMDGSFVL